MVTYSCKDFGHLKHNNVSGDYAGMSMRTFMACGRRSGTIKAGNMATIRCARGELQRAFMDLPSIRNRLAFSLRKSKPKKAKPDIRTSAESARLKQIRMFFASISVSVSSFLGLNKSRAITLSE